MASLPSSAGIAGPDTFPARLKALYETIFVAYWPYWAACVTAAVLNIFLLAYMGSAWGVTGELTRWGGHILTAIGVPADTWPYFEEIGLEGSPITRVAGYLTLGMLGGSLIGALLSGNFRIRMPANRSRLVQGFVGGFLAGFGARLAMGCNLGSFFSAVPQFSLHGWLFMLGMFPGTYLGTRLALLPWIMGSSKRKSTRRARPANGNDSRRRQSIAGLVVVALIFAWLMSLFGGGRFDFGIVLLFGLGFGLLIQRGRICFTSAFREMWITRQGELARALAFAMIISTLGFAVLIYNGIGGNVQVASPGVLIGGIIFGIGIVLAGGCESGWMYRSMEGYVQLWMAGLGTIAGATFLAWAWTGWGIEALLVEGWPAVNLVHSWGWSAALLSTLALLGAWYLVVTWWETRRFVPQEETASAQQPAAVAAAAATPAAASTDASPAAANSVASAHR